MVLLLPSDFMGETAVPSPTRLPNWDTILDRVVPPRDRITEAAAALASAKQPLIVAGGGVHISDAAAEVVRLSELGAIPVATTNMGKGTIDERAPLSLGVFGNCMGRGSRAEHLRAHATDADLVLFVGTRTNANGTDSWTLFPKAKFIHIDIDGYEIGRNFEALRLVGDAKATLTAILEELTKKDFPNRAGNLTRVSQSTDAALAKSNAILDEIGAGRQGSVRPGI